jgi:hypothetical protein
MQAERRLLFFRRIVTLHEASADGRLSTRESIELCRTVQAIIFNCLTPLNARMYFHRAAVPPRCPHSPLTPLILDTFTFSQLRKHDKHRCRGRAEL